MSAHEVFEPLHYIREILNSPGHAVHRIFISGWNQEAYRWHSWLAAFIVKHPPLEGLWVVQQSAFISSVHRDLEGDEENNFWNWLNDF